MREVQTIEGAEPDVDDERVSRLPQYGGAALFETAVRFDAESPSSDELEHHLE